MDNNSIFLFVYGSLLDSNNEHAEYLKRNSTPVNQGSFNGFLYDMGEYPGAVYHAQTHYKVYGTILQLTNPDILKIIDVYEGFGPAEEPPNLFIRQTLVIDTPAGPLNCWVYLYNLPVTGFKLIPSGKYCNQ